MSKEIEKLQRENKKLKHVIKSLKKNFEVVDYCLADFIITDCGDKIVNQKNLNDAIDLVKESLK